MQVVPAVDVYSAQTQTHINFERLITECMSNTDFKCQTIPALDVNLAQTDDSGKL